jgi:hypothetical protein
MDRTSQVKLGELVAGPEFLDPVRVRCKVPVAVVEAVDGSEVDSLDIVQAHELPGHLFEKGARRRGTEVQEDGLGRRAHLALSLEMLVANTESGPLAGHGVERALEGAREVQGVEE